MKKIKNLRRTAIWSGLLLIFFAIIANIEIWAKLSLILTGLIFIALSSKRKSD